MKVAVCFSGAVRYPHIGLDSLNSIRSKHDVKVFIHTWKIKDRDDFLKTIYDTKNKEIDRTVETDISFLENYNYESLLVENYENKKDFFQSVFDGLNFLDYYREDVGPISMHYSIFRSNELRKRYEEIHRISFDRVIRMRFDSDFQGKELNLDDLTFPICIPSGDDWAGGINDQFSVGSSWGMDVYSNIFWNYHNLQKISNYHPESILKNHLDSYNIFPERFYFPIQINNGIDWKRAVFGQNK